MTTVRGTFFTKDKEFYRSLFRMMFVLAMQNMIAFSVNMADNMMLGSYSQLALSGAATVNQIFFMVQQVAVAFGNALVVLGSQYWGEGKRSPIRRISGFALRITVVVSIGILIICQLFPEELLGIFTRSPEIIAEGKTYLQMVQWSFALFLISNMLMAVLRCVEVVNISFYISVVSLFINVGINYVCIFGKFGCPEMGIRGAAVGTTVARTVELCIVLYYILKVENKLQLFQQDFWTTEKALKWDYIRIMVPIFFSQMIWAITMPLQTAILGHLSSDAMAANSITSTFFSYMKQICIAMTSASSVMIGMSIGKGEDARIRSDARTISVIDLLMGFVMGAIMIALRHPILSFYALNAEAYRIADHLFINIGIIMVATAYQMTVSVGLIQGSGDGRFMVILNLISVLLVMVPLSVLCAFVWNLPVEAVAFVTQSDQLIKCIPVFLYFKSYKWVRKMTRE